MSERDIALLADDDLLPDLPAPRDRLWRLAAHPLRPRAEQPHRPGRSPPGASYLKSDGSPWRPIVHIEDISRAFIAALEAPEDAVFNRGVQCRPDRSRTTGSASSPRSSPRSCRAASWRYAAGCRAGQALLPGRLRQDRASSCPASSRLERGIWAPSSFTRPIARTALTLEEFEGPRYQRIGHIRKLIADGVTRHGPPPRCAAASRRLLRRSRFQPVSPPHS